MKIYGSLALVLISLLYLAFTKDKPYSQTSSITPKQTLANLEYLEGETILLAGYVESVEQGFFQLKGRSGSIIRLASEIKPPSRGREMIAKIHVRPGNKIPLVKKIYLYKGVTDYRVFLSLLPIPIIFYCFIREFKLRAGKFHERREE